MMLLKVYNKRLKFRNGLEIKKIKRASEKIRNNKFNQKQKIKEQKVEELVCSRMIDAFGVSGISKLSEEEYLHYKDQLWQRAFEEVFIDED